MTDYVKQVQWRKVEESRHNSRKWIS